MTDWDPAVETVPVKRARGRFAAQLLPVTQARAAIEQSVADAVRAADTVPHGQHNARGPGASRIRAGSPYAGRSLAVGVGGVTSWRAFPVSSCGTAALRRSAARCRTYSGCSGFSSAWRRR